MNATQFKHLINADPNANVILFRVAGIEVNGSIVCKTTKKFHRLCRQSNVNAKNFRTWPLPYECADN